MILSDIKRYLQAHGRAALADIATHFDADPDAVRGMLEVWERKGKVRKGHISPSCGEECKQCEASAVEIYHWVEGEVEEQPIHFDQGCCHD